MHNRWLQGRKRGKAVARMAAVHPGAAKLANTGVRPQACWGHQNLGLGPARLRGLRATMAKCTGSWHPGSCTTTTLALQLGPGADPALYLPVEILQAWLGLLASTPLSAGALATAWRRTVRRVSQGRRWAKVRGPMGATISTLLDLGWGPEGPTKWRAPDDQLWAVDPKRS